jgi:glycolate oxidase FAD binding subunit
METIPDPLLTKKTIPDPLWECAPATAEDVAAALRRASDARQAIEIRGAGTKSGWGRARGRVDAVLDMRRLSRILAHEHGDMTATVEAGATLHDLNRTLAQHGQWLPLDPPFADRATIGGILATNDSGPLRHRYGTPRDLVIGIRLATTDGLLAKAGGQVVKNVAGYDLGKLLTGSFGGLAAIVSATFKLAPIPKASKTLKIELDTAAAVARIVTTIMTSQLEPMAFEIVARPVAESYAAQPQTPEQLSSSATRPAFALLLRFASLPAVVDAQIGEATNAVRGAAASVAVLTGEAELTEWRGHADDIWRRDDDAIVRASWLPAHVETMLTAVRQCAAGADVSGVGRAAVGAGLIRIGGDADAQIRAIERLRTSGGVGNVVVIRAPAAVTSRVDPWAADAGRARLYESLKRTFDPHRVLVGHGLV